MEEDSNISEQDHDKDGSEVMDAEEMNVQDPESENPDDDGDKSEVGEDETHDRNNEELDDGPNEFECQKEDGSSDPITNAQHDGTEVPEDEQPEKSDEKDKKANAKKDWVAIVEADEGKLYTELQKIGKLISRQQKVSEIKRHAKKHRMRVFPITLDELNTPYIRSVLEMCSQVQMKWVTKRTDDGVIMNGILEMTFAKLRDAEEQKTKLKEFKKEISVWDNYDNSHEEETNRKFNKMAGIPVDADTNNKLTLLSPSLPTSVTEDELWELFPNAREIWLITGGKRHHAYLKFLDEETIQKTLTKLREQGPPRDDFSFCRLVRYYEVEHAIKYTRSGGSRRTDRHQTRSPRCEYHSDLSHSHSSRSETSDEKRVEHKSKPSPSSASQDKSPSKSGTSSNGVTHSKAESATGSAFDTDDKKVECEESSADKSASAASQSQSDKKGSKPTATKSRSDSKDSEFKPRASKADDRDSKYDSKDSRSVKGKSSDHSSKTSRSRSESKSLLKLSASNSHRSHDRSRSRSHSHHHRSVTRRHPDQKKLIIPFRKRERSPRRMKHSSLLGPTPHQVPSLLASGPMANSPMMMNRPLENVLSQLQRPNIPQPVMNPQVQHQQGMQVLDNLLSTFDNRPNSMPGMMRQDDGFRKRNMGNRRSRSRSPIHRGCSPMMGYDEPNKRIHVMNHSRDKVYQRDDFGASHQDNYSRVAGDTFRTNEFGRNDEYLAHGHQDDYMGYNQQFGQIVAPERRYDAGHMAVQQQNRETVNDQRSFNVPDVRIGRPIETVRTSDLGQVKKDTATLEGEYALMMNQIGQAQQRATMAPAYRSDYY